MLRSASFALLSTQVLPLRPRHCPALLFDCTHDNKTPRERRDARDALPNAALVAASCASIGSVRGYDELFAANPSVVSERRWYKDIEGVTPFTLMWPSLQAPPPEETTPTSLETQDPQEVEFAWVRGAKSNVVVRGSWDNWKADLPLKLQADGTWVAIVSLPSASLPVQYKFIVDGTWKCDRTKPRSDDGTGNVNNVLGPPAGSQGSFALSRVRGPDVVVSALPGIFSVKQVLNTLHVRLACEGFVKVGVQHLAGDIVAVQRRSPDTGRRTWFVARSAFARQGSEGVPRDTAPLAVPGSIAVVHIAATLFVPDSQPGFDESLERLEGQQCHLHLFKSLGEVARIWREGGSTMLKLFHFPPGSVLVFSTSPNGEASHQGELEALLAPSMIARPLQGLSLSDLNYLLFSCEAEELDRSGGARGAYQIADFGTFVYCGLMGVCAALDLERGAKIDLSVSPIVRNIREGDWLLRYLIQRLQDLPALQGVRAWLASVQAIIAKFPRDLVPFHFDYAVSELCAAACRAVIQGSGTFVSGCSGRCPLIRDLAVATAQFWAATPSAPLHWDRAFEEGWRKVPSLAAGLPHFASGFMRNWGRDTFIAFRGCLLITNRFAEARDTLLVYASVVRHGLCPNLLDAARQPRYNARDATWFFLQAIQDYVEMSPEGLTFMSQTVVLKWPVRDWDSDLVHLEPKTVADLIHLILQAHAKGISFRERNAGPGLDAQMTDKGFDFKVRLEEGTGLIYGGNEWNCGTWMDKMGSSSKAGNKGRPATPRDGAAVEIVGLLKSTLRWVAGLDRGAFPHAAVTTSSGAELSYKEWDARLQRNFERLFWVAPDERAPTPLRNFYKDTVGATRNWQDYQLRPNFPIAMAVAPELFSPQNARQALALAADRLVGPLGMCTLDPGEAEYRGDYRNDDDSADKSVAHGWNYHQGPEWLWPLGFFLKAWHHFYGKDEGGSSAGRRDVFPWLLKHRSMLHNSAWRSLPELTNSTGSVCSHACPAQAWSVATLLDALHSLEADEALE
mmetsp:Transcript_124228/g.397636  ORF Transcript_124228/g.397636 Transcript_124228/m.397636 type:complete len:1019 (+) Transcript_124228:79-3135(+)